MSNPITSGQRMAQIDRILEYIPVVSTVINIINIFQKAVIEAFQRMPTKENHHYFYYLDKGKSYWRSLAAIVPVFGNIGLGIYDYRKGKSESEVSSRPSSAVLESPSSSDESSRVKGGAVSPPPPSSLPSSRSSSSSNSSSASEVDESSEDDSDIISSAERSESSPPPPATTLDRALETKEGKKERTAFKRGRHKAAKRGRSFLQGVKKIGRKSGSKKSTPEIIIPD